MKNKRCESNQSLQVLFDAAPLAFIAVDSKGNLTQWNSAAEKMFGWQKNETIGRPLPFVTDENEEEHRNLCLRTMQGESFSDIEFLRKRKDGSPIHIGVSTAPIRNGRGDVTGITYFCTDISEHKRMEEARQANEERFRLAVQAAQEGVWDWNMETNEVWYSPRYKKMLGYSEDELENHVNTWLSLLHPDDREHSLKIVDAVTHGTLDYEIEFRLRHKDGHYLYILSRGFPVRRKSDGKVVRIVGTHFDLTERKRYEQNLKFNEERYRLALDAARMGSYHWNVSTGEAVLSDMCRRIFGFPPDSPVSYDNWLASIIPEDRDATDQAARSAMENRSNFDTEFRILRSDGSVRWISSKGKFFYGEDGSALRMEGVVSDISEHKLAKDALIKTQYILTESQRIAHTGSFEYFTATGQTVWSDEQYRIYGLEPAGPSPSYQDLIARAIHPEDANLLRRTFAAALQSSSFFELEYRIVRPGGSVRWLYSLAHPYFDDTGKLDRYIGTTLDITERKQREEELRRSEEKYRQIFDVESDALFLVEVDSLKILDVNSSVETLYGYSRDEMLTMHSTDVSAEQDQTSRAFQQAIDHVPIRWHRKKDGSVFPVEISGSYFYLGDKRIHLAAIRDITRRLQLETSLKESEKRWQFALEASGDGIWDWNLETNEVFYSDQWKAMLGFETNEMASTFDEWDSRIHPQDRKRVYDAIHRHFAGGSPLYQSEHRMKCKDGSYKWILDRGKVITWNDSGKPLRMIGTHTDLSERKKAEEILKSSKDLLEKHVEERTAELIIKTASLEELNTALRVVLNQREEDRKIFDETLAGNLQRLILPYIEKLQKTALSPNQATYLAILQSHVAEIGSRLLRKLSLEHQGLTPTEMQVAILIRDGKGTKNIAETLRVSVKAVEFHRNNIRRKLGIKNKKENLKSHLIALS